jgi:hypothetical protein
MSESVHTAHEGEPSRRHLLGVASGLVLGASTLAAGGTAHAAGAERAGDDIVSVMYVEVNDNDLVHVADYSLAGTGTPVFDLGVIFAANINYDGSRAYLSLNEQVRATLEDAEHQVRPLQDRGIKVLLSILPNHQGAGFANFPDADAASAFASELASVVDRYGLDGIDFDDEYAEYGTGGTGMPNEHSFVDLVLSLREKLGEDRLITLYNIGPSAERTTDGDRNAADALNYAWNPYYGTWAPPEIAGMGTEKLAAGAVDVAQTDLPTISKLAQRTVDEHYGVFLAYNLSDTDASDQLTAFTEELYGAGTVRHGTAYATGTTPHTDRDRLATPGAWPCTGRPIGNDAFAACAGESAVRADLPIGHQPWWRSQSIARSDQPSSGPRPRPSPAPWPPSA